MTAVYPSRFGNGFVIAHCLVRRIGLLFCSTRSRAVRFWSKAEI